MIELILDCILGVIVATMPQWVVWTLIGVSGLILLTLVLSFYGSSI